MKIFFLLCFAAILSFTSCGTSTSGRDYWGHRPGPKGFHTVILDAGHGGHDSGAVSPHNGVKEKDIALDLAKKIRSELSGYKVHLLRENDQFIDLDERVNRANENGDAVLISIHFNSSASHVRGPETYYWRVDSHGLATRLQEAMESVCPQETGNRKKVRRRLRLTRNPEIPCVLIECGYLSHPAEAQLCATEPYRSRMAAAIAQAIRDQSSRGDTGTGSLPQAINSPLSRPTDR